MKKLMLFCMLAMFCLAFPLSAHAAGDKFDMRKTTCSDIEDENSLLMIISWMDGYQSAKTGDMVVDAKTLETNVEKIAEVCKEKPKQKIFDLYK